MFFFKVDVKKIETSINEVNSKGFFLFWEHKKVGVFFWKEIWHPNRKSVLRGKMGEQLEPVCFFASTAALVRVGLLTKVEWVRNLYKVVFDFFICFLEYAHAQLGTAS